MYSKELIVTENENGKGYIRSQKIGNYSCFPNKPGSNDPGLFFFCLFYLSISKVDYRIVGDEEMETAGIA